MNTDADRPRGHLPRGEPAWPGKRTLDPLCKVIFNKDGCQAVPYVGNLVAIGFTLLWYSSIEKIDSIDTLPVFGTTSSLKHW